MSDMVLRLTFLRVGLCLMVPSMGACAGSNAGPPGAVLEGFVVDEASGEPLEATVTLGADPASGSVSTRTDGSGRYGFDVDDGARAVTAVVPGYRSESRLVHWSWGITRARVDMLLRPDVGLEPSQPSCAVVGSIQRQEGGEPLVEAAVSLNLPRYGAVQSGWDGSFIVLNVPAGLQRFSVRRIGYYDEERTILVRCPDGVIDIPLRFLMREDMRPIG